MSHDLAAMADAFLRDGLIRDVPLLDPRDARAQRIAMESVEAGHGPLHGLPKIHTLLDFAADLAAEETALDVVEALLGPDIVLLDVSYAVVEAGARDEADSAAGPDSGDQVRMRIALSATADGAHPGEATFARGGTPFPACAAPDDARAIFLVARYAIPAVPRAASGTATATLLRGEDAHLHHDAEILATGVMEEDAVERYASLRDGRGTQQASG